MTTRTHAPLVTHAELLALVPELRAAGVDPDELSDELENAATTGCGTDSLASLRVELGLDRG